MRTLALTILALLPLAAQTSTLTDIPGFDSTALDRAVSPCQNFYQYACGGWRARNPIPPDQARWGRFDELVEHNREVLRDILEKATAAAPDRTPDEQKIGDYYAACMDEAAIARKGVAVLQPELDRIASARR